MAVIEKEFGMMNVMITGRADPKEMEKVVPWVDILTVNKCKIIGIDRAKGHVAPHIAVN